LKVTEGTETNDSATAQSQQSEDICSEEHETIDTKPEQEIVEEVSISQIPSDSFFVESSQPDEVVKKDTSMIVQFVTNGGQIQETQQEFDEDFEILATQYPEEDETMNQTQESVDQKDEIQEETLENVNETEIEASQPTIVGNESLSIETD
jgi:hypothetical protein